MTKRLSRVILTVLILILGVSGTYSHAQPATAQPKTRRATGSAQSWGFAGHQYGDEGSIENAAWDRGCVFAKDHRRATVQNEDRSAE